MLELPNGHQPQVVAQIVVTVLDNGHVDVRGKFPPVPSKIHGWMHEASYLIVRELEKRPEGRLISEAPVISEPIAVS